MSRGLSQRQREILALLGEAEDQQSTIETLRWTLFEKASRKKLPATGSLPTAWNTSFTRSIEGLEEHGKLTITPRPLISFEECVAHYPGKTLKAAARKLRMDLLPLLLEWSREKSGLIPQYDSADNEEHHWRRLRKDDTERASAVRAEWWALDEILRPLFGSATSGHADHLLRLICRGRYLFVSSDIRADYPLAVAISGACTTGSLPPPVVDRLQIFADLFIPRTRAAELRFTSFIHRLANVPSLGQCTLKGGTLEFLHRRQTDYIQGMPGFEAKFPNFRAGPGLPPPDYFKYPAELLKLIDQSVFHPFRFIALN